jgi:TolB-like protein
VRGDRERNRSNPKGLVRANCISQHSFLESDRPIVEARALVRLVRTDPRRQVPCFTHLVRRRRSIRNAARTEKKAPRPAAKRRTADPPLREIHVAVLPIGATREVKIDSEALTDQVHMLMASLASVTLVDRDEIDKVIQEQELALTGLVDANQAVQLGKLLSAQYILVGRASRVGESTYLVLRLVDVETARQTTISAKGPADLDRADQIDFVRQRGMTVVIENLPPTKNVWTSRERSVLGGVRSWPVCWTMPWRRNIGCSKRCSSASCLCVWTSC